MQTTVSPTQAPPKPAPVVTTTMASRVSRLLAAIVDSAAFLVVYLIACGLNEPTLFLLGLFCLAVVQIYFLTTRGQTIGKIVLHVKIVKVDVETNGGFVTNVLLRSILNAILGFIPLYALVDALFIFRQDRRCIHDMIAGTKVVQA
jgi:uncharacterized RDD family membrane protein YckC